MAKPIPLEDIYQPVDWKAEYLKSVESGCITLDELREANAELDATNRQVEILSDALAESRREVAALKAVQEPVAQYTVDVSGAAEPSCEPLNWHKTAAQPAPVQATMKLESSGPGYGPAPKQKLSVRHVSLIDEGKTSAQPAVPDAFGTREGEHPQYIQGWNDCRAEMLKGMK
jgi:hypothetical protein